MLLKFIYRWKLSTGCKSQRSKTKIHTGKPSRYTKNFVIKIQVQKTVLVQDQDQITKNSQQINNKITVVIILYMVLDNWEIMI